MNSLVYATIRHTNYYNKNVLNSYNIKLFYSIDINKSLKYSYSTCNYYRQKYQTKRSLLDVKYIFPLINNYRSLWGRKRRKPGEIEPGLKAKDVTLVGNLFKEIPDKHKEQFLAVVDRFPNYKYVKREGYAEFIIAALPYLKEYGLQEDLDTYKALMNVFPKNKYQPTNQFQAGLYHYPLEQSTACSILHQMNFHGVMPDKEMEHLIISIFSKHSAPWRRCARMIYWMTKLKNISPFPLPEVLPQDAVQLAIIALKQICLDVQTKISVFSTSQLANSTDKTWIVSAQSPAQNELISEMSDKESIYVEGSFRVWLKNRSISYFMLRANHAMPVLDEMEVADELNDVSAIPLSTFGKQKKEESITPSKSIHLQDDGKILALCATGTSSRDSLVSWIQILQSSNPKLKTIPVIFSIKSPTTALQEINERDSSENTA